MSTQCAFYGLTSAPGEKTYSQFVFTDISGGFFLAARERIAPYQGIEFNTLDISKDPIDQGVEAGSFDLIFASKVLHATPELNTTLKNVRKLLYPRGQLIMIELTPSKIQFINFIMGFFPGWWLGEADGRPDCPFVCVERWDKELKNAGFKGLEAKVYNDPREDWYINACIVARLPQPEKDLNVTLLCPTESSAKVDQIHDTLVSHGYKVNRCTLGGEIPPHQDVIFLLELEAPMFHSISEVDFELYKRFVEGLGSAGVLWVTHSSQMDCKDPRYDLILGLSRVMRTELSIPFSTLEMDVVDTTAIMNVFDKFHARNLSGVIDPDWEYSFSNGVINVGRFHWMSEVKDLASVPIKEKQPMKLEIGRPGLLSSLGWVQYQMPNLEDEVSAAPLKLAWRPYATLRGQANFAVTSKRSPDYSCLRHTIGKQTNKQTNNRQ